MTCSDPYARQWARHYGEKRRQARANAQAATDPELQKRIREIQYSVANGVKCVSVHDGRRL